MNLRPPSRPLPRRRLLKLIAPVLAALATAGGASAYLSSSGSGTGTGSASASLANVTVTAGLATESLLPTGSATGDLNVTLNNANPTSVHISSLQLDTSQGTAGFSANAASCALSFAAQTGGGNGWTIPANGSVSADLTNSVTMGTSAASSCQGQSFTVYLMAS